MAVQDQCSYKYLDLTIKKIHDVDFGGEKLGPITSTIFGNDVCKDVVKTWAVKKVTKPSPLLPKPATANQAKPTPPLSVPATANQAKPTPALSVCADDEEKFKTMTVDQLMEECETEHLWAVREQLRKNNTVFKSLGCSLKIKVTEGVMIGCKAIATGGEPGMDMEMETAEVYGKTTVEAIECAVKEMTRLLLSG